MTYKSEQIFPYSTSENKTVQVERMFDEIAANYDKLNHTLSMGIDKSWRKKGILSLKDIQPRQILDIATGTGDLAVEAYYRLQPDHITGIDISEGMMEVGRQKVARSGLSDQINFEKQDCASMDFPNDTFDAAMVAFGVRNFENLDQGLKEILRVLRPGGKLMILELSSPERFPMKQLYKLYSRMIIPAVGRLISRSKAAYKYLPRSVAAFPQGETMAAILRKNGFREVYHKTYTLGICTLYLGTK